MAINISDMVVNIGQQASNSELLELFKIIFSIVFGGYITYIAAEKAKNNEIKRENIKKFAYVGQIATFCFNDIGIYKEQVLNPIKNRIENSEIELESSLASLYIPNNKFKINIEEYIFLADNNLLFPDLLNKTNTMFNLYEQSIENYNENIRNIITSKTILKEEYRFDKEKYIKVFELLERTTNELFIRLFFILKNCNICHSKFYNLSCLDNIEENFQKIKIEENPVLKEILESEHYRHIVEYQENFEKNWVGHPKCFCTICFIARKIKHKFKWLKDFFALPKNCQFTCWKKNKGK